jgi:asparaginyl-tRNA synthetase
MTKSLRVADALLSPEAINEVSVSGWVRTKRDSKTFSFIEINDGSCLKNIQVILDHSVPDSSKLPDITTGASIKVDGELVESKGKGQTWEVVAKAVTVLGTADNTFPLQKKGHSPEFLREIAHLRPRTNLFGAVFRVRSRLAYAVHNFFQERGFNYVHTPIITSSDCEGAGEMFRVTTLDLENLPKGEDGKISFEDDFFTKSTYLTVSGQLEAETLACSLGNVYTFGPTFRAENSHTKRHASEFWMIEPEMAFCDLQGDMEVAEAFVKHLVSDIMDNCAEDLAFFNRFVDKGLLKRLQFVREKPFKRVSYTEAIELLEKSGKKFEFPVEYGVNLQSEHERYLAEECYNCPVTIYNYPKEIKPFYMRLNDDDKTVTAMDVIVPGIGEIVGGSQREERLDVLLANMDRHNLNKADYQWYIDLRKYGSVPHSGFGLGFERMLMFVTGVANIRDVIPFARTPGSADF